MPEQLRRRALPYPGAGMRLFLPSEIWQRSLRVVRAYGRQRSEALVFWGGVPLAGGVLVTGLYLPRHPAQGARVRIEPDAARWLLRGLRERDEKLVGQVHSHPDEGFHSSGDDRGATSFHPGFWSIVVPRYGRGVGAVTSCAVHEFDGQGFVSLDAAAIAERVVVTNLTEERQ